VQKLFNRLRFAFTGIPLKEEEADMKVKFDPETVFPFTFSPPDNTYPGESEFNKIH
jgi:hypothetical protein